MKQLEKDVVCCDKQKQRRQKTKETIMAAVKRKITAEKCQGRLAQKV
jgi:hypothetical protein